MSDPTAEITADDLNCPMCDYSLRGLPEPRCPECGYAFEWEELRRRTESRRQWFYEHAQTFRSHLKTRWRSLRPWSFWREIRAYTEANPRRLRRYQLVTLGLAVLLCMIAAFPVAATVITANTRYGTYVMATTLPASGRYHLIRSPPIYHYVPRTRPATRPARAVSTTFSGTTYVLPYVKMPSNAQYQQVLAPPAQQLYTYMPLPHPAVHWLRRFALQQNVTSLTARAASGAGVSVALIFALPLY